MRPEATIVYMGCHVQWCDTLSLMTVDCSEVHPLYPNFPD